MVSISSNGYDNRFNSYFNQCNPDQKKAIVDIDGSSLVLAAAGTGKTKVLTTRFIYILKKKKIQPFNILTITFTNKAAREIYTRVIGMLADEHLNSDFWIGTFHALCLRILRFNSNKIKSVIDIELGSNFQVIDNYGRKNLIKATLKEMGQDAENKEYLGFVIGKVNSWQNKGILPNDKDFLYEFKKLYGRDNFGWRFYQKFYRNMLGNNVLDFNSIISFCTKLLERNADVLEKYRRIFQYIMVDEYQDTNFSQYHFIKLLAAEHRNLFCVGDDDQAIYTWRGACGRLNIQAMRNDFPECRLYKLEQNYRSDKRIVDIARKLIQCNNFRSEKNMWTEIINRDNKSSLSINKYNSDVEEAFSIIKEIKKIIKKEKKVSYRDIAILVRTNSQSKPIEEILLRKDIPYYLSAGVKLLDRKEIRIIISYLKFIINPFDRGSFLQVINVPKRGLGKVSVEKILEHPFVKEEKSLLAVCSSLVEEEGRGLSKKMLKGLKSFLHEIDCISKELNNTNKDVIKEKKTVRNSLMSVIRKIVEIIDPSLLDEENEKSYYVISLIKLISSFRSIKKFLDSFTLFSVEEEQLPIRTGIMIGTIHSAKGLEFDYIFLPGWEEGVLPHFRSIRMSLVERDIQGIEEERRLAYVAVTRAKKRCYISWASRKTVNGRSVSRYSKSRFIEEIEKTKND